MTIFDLQMFADGVSGIPVGSNAVTGNANPLNINTTNDTAATSGNELSYELKDFYSKQLLENLRANLVFNQFSRDEGIPQGNGKKISWRKFSPYSKALTPLTEGVTPAGTKMNVSEIEAEVAQYGAYTPISDVLDTVSVDNVLLVATDEHSAQAEATIDTITRNELMTGTNVYYAPSVSGSTVTPVKSRFLLDSNAKLTPSVVNRAATILKKANAPTINGKYVAIIHPSVSEDLRESAAWLDVHKYDATAEIFNGEIGELHGVRFIETTEQKVMHAKLTVKTDASAATSTNPQYVYVKEKLNDGAAVASCSIPCHVGDTANTITAIAAWNESNGTRLTMETQFSATVTANTVITNDIAVYACMFLAQGAYGTINVDGMGLEMIIKPRGAGEDPLNQRQTVGWKCTHAAKILDNLRMVRVECGSSQSDIDVDN